jgi:hypothetical protein
MTAHTPISTANPYAPKDSEAARDFQRWIETTAAPLRQGDLTSVDRENLNEASESMNPWEVDILNFRDQIVNLLEDSPSVKPYLCKIFEVCDVKAIKMLYKLTGRKIPTETIMTLEEALEKEWFSQ